MSHSLEAGPESKVPLLGSVEDVTAEWLSSALSIRFPDTHVEAIGEADVRRGTTTNIRLRLNFRPDGNPHSLPEVIWLKAGLEKHSPDLAEQVGIYESEARFYAHAQPFLKEITPRCFFAMADQKAKYGLIMIEDLILKGAEVFHSTRAVSLDDAYAVVDALAILHRAAFTDPALKKQKWMKPLLQYNAYWNSETKPDVIQRWLEDERALTYPKGVQDPHRISSNLIRMAGQMPGDLSGLVHGDAHVANSFRVRGGMAGFFDWQCVGLASPIFDLVYYVVSSLDTDVRRSEEDAILKHYLARFDLDSDILSLDEARLAYRRYAAYGLWAWMTNPVAFHPQQVNIIQSNRFANAVEDLATFDAIEQWN